MNPDQTAPSGSIAFAIQTSKVINKQMREQRTIVVNVGKRVKQCFEKLAYAWFTKVEKRL